MNTQKDNPMMDAVDDHEEFMDDLLKKLKGDEADMEIGVNNGPDDKVYFDRFYVCLNGLKEGWKNEAQSRRAVDCNWKGWDNHIFPVAWDVVNVENKQNWTWFLELVASDLEVEGGVRLTPMSDQHKGLLEAVKDIMPYAEHRQCARHIYENFRKKYSGVEFRNLFWASSKCSYPVLFNTTMEKVKAANPNAFTYLIERNPKSWSRAFFEIERCCEAVENGFSKCFNAVIVQCRHKPIITMLESIRVIVMERMNVMRMVAEFWIGGSEFEVRHKNEAFKVNEETRTCSCRMWQLSGIPCPHACSVIFALNKSPEDYIPAYFRKDMYMRAYTTYLKPVGEMTTWVPNQQNKLLPPPTRTMPGRPKRKRRRAAHEGGSGVRVSKVGAVMTCKNYLEAGHNIKGCKNAPKQKDVAVSKPVGRPRKQGR
ncbi:uncharacterized protein [Rutidosis leptorrhynchoides]|uniref:uncharacterized protein n=1 Tax=Rutidosis leptorrhynchoides TaxID=125765 RepID=UPI003A997CA7